MMQTDPTAEPAIYSQQQQHQEQLMMPLPPEAGFWPQQPQPQPQPQVMVQQSPQQLNSADEIRTLWIGGLQHWMDENYLHGCFALTQDLLSVKIIRNTQTGLSEGYGFLEFASNAAAQVVLQNYNGVQMPRTKRFYRLNWATNIGSDRSEDFTIFVGDLAFDDTDELLLETFRAIYPSVKGAKVIIDKVTGRSKGYGFVTFGDGNEQARAITEMNGIFCSSRPMRIGPAVTKQTTVYQQPHSPQVVDLDPENDPNNTTVFVGGLDPNVTVEMLMGTFGHYGELVHANIPWGMRCGFVHFSNRASAELAMQMLHGTVLGQRPIRLSWGRNKQVQRAGSFQTQQPDPNQWNGAYYGDGQGYNAGSSQTQQPDPNQWNGAYYGNGQGYNPGYGSVTQPQHTDPNQWNTQPQQTDPNQWNTQPQQTEPNPWNAINYSGNQGSNADYSYATQPYNASYAYATQPQNPNMFIKPNPWNAINYSGNQGSNADYSYATQPYNASYAYATQPQYPNMFINMAPNANYQQHPQ